MDPELQKFINLIFDMSVVKNTIKEIGYNAKKMPLGKLGEGTIKKAYEVLNKLSEAIKNG
jgi:poly [ADP-ribose] polymerase